GYFVIIAFESIPISRADIEFSAFGSVPHAHQLKDGYKTKFCSFELKSPQMGGFIKNKHAK
ncbi:hypothetical protein P4H52_04185, partial [Bacillus cereus]|nr:hypothetical protein [Bacillus cereus]